MQEYLISPARTQRLTSTFVSGTSSVIRWWFSGENGSLLFKETLQVSLTSEDSDRFWKFSFSGKFYAFHSLLGSFFFSRRFIPFGDCCKLCRTTAIYYIVCIKSATRVVKSGIYDCLVIFKDNSLNCNCNSTFIVQDTFRKCCNKQSNVITKQKTCDIFERHVAVIYKSRLT